MTCCIAPVAVQNQIAEAVSNTERFQHDRMVAGSIELRNGVYKTEFIVPEMHCAGCLSTIERGLAELPMVTQVRANLSLKSVSVIWDKSKGSIVGVSNKLDRLGFDHHLSEEKKETSESDSKARSLLLALAVAGFAAANIMLLSVSVWSGASEETAQLFHLVSGLIAIPAVSFAGRPFFTAAYRALSAKRLNMDVPISLAVLLALGMSVFESITGGHQAYFDASVTLLFFLLIGRYLDHMMRQKARGAVERLSSLAAKSGVVIQSDGELAHVDLKDVKPGMRLRVFAGERFPVNGTIVSGDTDIDRSHVTGESESALATVGNKIEAGTLNLTAPVDFETTTSAETSFLAEMRNMMEAAENGRGEYTRVADRMAQIYAPAVHLLAFVTFVAWMFFSAGDWHTSIYTAIAVLIVTCPCALGLAVPVAHVIGANRLLQSGILMRDGTALERLANINTIIFDKTGTLTRGEPVVTETTAQSNDLFPVLKALASNSHHPIARAIDASLAIESINTSIDIKERPGLGVEGVYKGKTARLGKPEWIAQIASPAFVPKNARAGFALEGESPVWFEVEDILREDAARTVSMLKDRSLMLEMLSGDSSSNVICIASKVGIENYRFSQSPKQKIAHIEDHQQSGNKVLMVGDGINDAPALAGGYVSMVPASASDVGRHAADFVFTRQSLSAIPFAYDIAKYTDQIVKQNFGLAIAYNCIAVPLAMSGYVTPLIAAIAMSASSIVVIANSFRINFAIKSKYENREILKQSEMQAEAIA